MTGSPAPPARRLTADERLRRLLALVPWVVAHDGPRVGEVCERFGLTPRELAAELDLVFLCGVYPYTPDTLIEVVWEGDRVFIRYADYFGRPLRLTPAEGLALAARGAALLAVPGADLDGPLARGLRKLATSLGVEPSDVLDVELGSAPEDVLARLRGAVEARRRVELDYYAYGRDARALRVVDPYAVFTAEGAWYLAGHDHGRGAERRFRVDRVLGLRVLDETFDPPDQPPDLAVYEARPDDRRVELELGPRAAWVAEQYPIEARTDLGGGRTRVRLAVSERAWLERLLLRLGPDARVVEGGDGVAADAARRVLARYRAATAPGGSVPADG